MARPREFDIQLAVERAMNAFWTRGYNGTSLSDLLCAMQITRGSLYKAFGSKKALFIQSLTLYDERFIKPTEAMLQARVTTGESRLENVFSGAVAAVETGDRRGCLLCNTSAGASSEDEEIAAIVRDQLRRLTLAFSIALHDTAVWGKQSPEKRMAEARSLSLNYVGLRVMARGGLELKNLKQAATQSMMRFKETKS